MKLTCSAIPVSAKRRVARSLLRRMSHLLVRRRSPRTVVLMYHAIGHSRYAVTPDDFEAHMKYLKDHACVVSLENIISGRFPAAGVPFTCAITFDDGYRGVYEYAYPILQRYGFPAVLYVTTSALAGNGTPRPTRVPGFFPGEAILTWHQLREMSEGGIRVGSHLCHHLDMRQLSVNTGLTELSRSREIISQQVSAPCTDFAYPFGLFNARNADWVSALRYESAVTVQHRAVPHNLDRFRIPRMSVAPETSGDFEPMLRGDMDYLLIVRQIRQLLSLPI
jgi:peptidoglycan/xylan/chitin deacetylase (PgdA/CDA1 family)